MFTGIIEALGRVEALKQTGGNLDIKLSCPFVHELKPDQSVAHNGVCLTVTKVMGDRYWVTAIQETLNRTNLGQLKIGDPVNLERCMRLQDRVDGHIVQGHVDTQAELLAITEEQGSWRLTFCYPAENAGLLVDKGSVTLNGVSLTVIQPDDTTFSVALIPYTWEHTQFHQVKPGDRINVEFDILGKFVERMLRLSGRI